MALHEPLRAHVSEFAGELDPAGHDHAILLLFGADATDHHAIVQRTKFHWILVSLVPAVEDWSRCAVPCLHTSYAGHVHSGLGCASEMGLSVPDFKLLVRLFRLAARASGVSAERRRIAFPNIGQADQRGR